MASATTPDSLVAGVREAIQKEADRLREEAIAKAVADFETQLREGVARAALNVGHYYEIERDAGKLVITVRHAGLRDG